MIVRNEEANLPACLHSVADLVHEIVIVDTGSTDRTRAVADSFNARVFDFPWVDDFAAARNESVRHATGDWVFWLDGDEWLTEENRERLRAVLAGLTDELAAYAMTQCCRMVGEAADAVMMEQVRLFRRHPQVAWQYRVHEQIQPAVERLGGRVYPTGVVIEHSGYADEATYRRKLGRNLRLLWLEEAERPGDPFTLFNLGWTHQCQGDVAAALPFYRRSLERAPAGTSFRPKLYALLARGHHWLGERPAALEACRAGRQSYPDDVELLFLEGVLCSELGDLAGAEACFTRLLSGTATTRLVGVDVDLTGYKARHNLARVYRAQGRAAEAEAQWRQVVTERPDSLPAWLELGELCVEQGRLAEVDAIGERVRGFGPSGTLVVALLEAQRHVRRGELAAARDVLQAASAAARGAVEPRVRLGRLLLQMGDRAAAEQAWREVLALDPNHVEARGNLASRTEQV
jgi:tetratricopeptide (TPR) repeat protein